MQLALYRAERPEVFEDIIGQKQIVKILQNQIKTGTVSQAYLFTGTRGTGKTSTARILAKAVNCLEGEPGDASINLPCGHCDNCEAIREGKFVDVIELDAASNNGVDDIRAITELVKYPPTIGRYKVFIIDEVHMLTQGAENAFLKTLEEPPEYAIFILATTDPQKVRQTIKSRCMQLNFKRVSEEELVAGMQRICKKKGVDATEDALRTVASKADGSVRDALSILEQCMAGGDKSLDKNMVLEYTGAAGEDFYLALTGAVHDGDLGKALLYIDEILRRGKDAKQILKDWLEHYRNLMVVKYVNKAERVVSASAENIERLRAQAEKIDIRQIERAIRLISEYINVGRYSDRPRILLETVAVRLAGTSDVMEPGEMGSTAFTTKASKESIAKAASYKPVRSEAKQAPVQETVFREVIVDDGGFDDDEPIVEITAAPREAAGDADDMWERIASEMSRSDASFGTLVARNSMAESYDNEELIIRIKKNKLSLAEDKLDDIISMAKKIYGPSIYVTLRGGELEPKHKNVPEMSEAETNEVMDEDTRMSELTDDLSNLFGMEVDVIDK